MSTHKMFFAGSGGQGIMLMGQMVGSAAIHEDKEATFFPSYGPEMRGGTANCTVIVSDKPISSPLIFESDCVVAMTLPSLLKFEPTLKPGGVLLVNKSIIHQCRNPVLSKKFRHHIPRCFYITQELLYLQAL